MKSEYKKVICPDCKREMNRHAEKPNYSVPIPDRDVMDPAIGAVVEDAYSCPGCGQTQLVAPASD